MQKVIINASKGGSDIGSQNGSLQEKDFNLQISKIIYDNLKSLGVDAYLVRDSDQDLSQARRLEIINSYITENDEVIVLTNMLSNGLDSGAEIIYALRNPDTLANILSTYIEEAGQNILKFYQLRDPNNTSMDYYDIIKYTNEDVESVIVSYGYPETDKEFLEANIEILGKKVAEAIYDYITKESLYTVKEGDSLYEIAQKFNTTVEDLKEANYLSSNSLSLGQELLIPKAKNTFTNNFKLYTVKPGDSLYQIAKDNNTTVNVLKEINNLMGINLEVGMTLKIPTEITMSDTKNYLIYNVKAGDNLANIALKYGTSVAEIKNLNGLSNNDLAIGETLKIPSSSEPYFNYRVKKGDSLYKLALLYNTSVSAIKSLNNLDSNNLAVDQVLKIPRT